MDIYSFSRVILLGLIWIFIYIILLWGGLLTLKRIRLLKVDDTSLKTSVIVIFKLYGMLAIVAILAIGFLKGLSYYKGTIVGLLAASSLIIVILAPYFIFYFLAKKYYKFSFVTSIIIVCAMYFLAWIMQDFLNIKIYQLFFYF